MLEKKHTLRHEYSISRYVVMVMEQLFSSRKGVIRRARCLSSFTFVCDLSKETCADHDSRTVFAHKFSFSWMARYKNFLMDGSVVSYTDSTRTCISKTAVDYNALSHPEKNTTCSLVRVVCFSISSKSKKFILSWESQVKTTTILCHCYFKKMWGCRAFRPRDPDNMQ